MSMIAVCDGCGKQEPASCHHGQWFKPGRWFERTPLDANGRQLQTITACSRECIDRIADKAEPGSPQASRVVLPI